MGTQVTVRLSDESAAFLDEQVANGGAKSRASVLERLVRRELRRQAALEDAAIYRSGQADPDLDEFVAAAAAALPLDDLP